MAFPRRIGLAFCTTVACLGNPASAGTMSLISVLEQLVGDGFPIIYSTDLVDPAVQVDLDEVSLSALKAALPAAGLILEHEQGVYVVAQLASMPSAPTDPPRTQTPEIQNRLETMIVTGTRHQLSGVLRSGSVSTLSGEDLRLVPSLGSDAMRAATRLPGMSSVGVSAKPQIRGGLPDEVLVRVDGVELFDAYHLADFQSFFSVVDDRTVDAVDVYTGGFPARYGNRMSGVMDIATRDQQAEGRTELGLSTISVFANTSGRLNSDRTHHIASLRYSNLKYLTDGIGKPIGTPRYYDAYGQIRHELETGTTLTAGMLLTRDDVTTVDDVETADSSIDNRYLWFRLERPLTQHLTSSSLLTLSWSDRNLIQRDPAEDPGEVEAFLSHDQSVDMYNVRSDFAYRSTGSLMEFGIEAEWAKSAYDSEALVDRGDLGQLLHGARFRAHDISVQPDGWSGGVYWSGDFEVADGMFLLPGVRWDFQEYYQFGAKDQLSPRVGLRYQLTPGLSLRLDAGRYYQPEAIHELQIADGNATFSKPQRSDHLVFGGEWLTASEWELRFDVYRKNYKRTKIRFENLFNPFVMIPELEADRISLAPSRARARGLDAEVRKRWPNGVSSALRYSYMDAEDRFDSGWVPRRWSQRHTVNAVVAWRREAFTLAAALTWHSGWRGATPPSEVPADEMLRAEEILNNTELRDYVTLDLSASRTWRFNRAAITLFADVTNVLDRQNVSGIDWDASNEDGVFVFERSTDLLLPIIPSAGFVIAF